MKQKIKQLQSFFLVLLLSIMSTATAWAASGDELFSQNFNSATAVAYTNGVATSITSSSSNNIVGTTAASQFSFIGITEKSSTGIAINSATGGNSVSAEGIFRAYCNNTGQKWSIVHNTGFAATAPTALKVSMKIHFKQLSSGADYSVSFAVGDGFSNSTNSPASSNVHSGFSILNNSTAKLTQYLTKTSIYDTGITQDSWLAVTWVINNTGSSLEYTGPNSSSATVNNDCFDLWIGNTKVVTNQAATTATKTLQNLYIGEPAGKKNTFQLDDVVVTDLSPAGGSTYTVSSAVSPAGAGTVEMRQTNGSGSTISSGSSVAAGTDIWMEATAANAGYTFSTWSNGATTTTNPHTYSSLDADKTFQANFTANTYTITLNKNSGSADGTATATYNSGSLTSKTDATPQSGYVLEGYYKEPACTTKVASANGTLVESITGYTDASGNWIRTSATTLYAKWVEASGSTKFQFVAKTSSSSLKLDGSSSEVEITTSNNATTLTGGRLYYTSVSEQDCKSGIVLSTTKNPEYLRIALGEALKNGDIISTSITGSKDARCLLLNTTSTYDDDGPRTSAGNSGTYTVTSGDGLAGATELYIWRGASTTTRVLEFTITSGSGGGGTTYTMTYNGNGKDGGTDVTDSNSPYDSGATVTVLANTWTKSGGYSFNGWNTASGGGGDSYAAGDKFTISANTTLYAQWTNQYTVTINRNGGSTGSESVTATYGSALPSFTASGKTGYDLAGYYTAASEGTKIINADGTLVASTDYANASNQWNYAGAATFYAQWTAKTYAVTIDANNGTGGDGTVTATYDAALPSFTAPIRSGYVLTGYYTTASGEGSKVINADGTLVASVEGYTDSNSKWIKADVATLHARWAAVYTVTFDATTNVGTCSTASLTQETSGASIILPVATKEGSTFNGWYTASSDGTFIGAAGASYTPTANITLYAQFTSAASTMKFHFLSKTSTANINGTVSVTEDNYADDLDGGSLTYFSDGSRDYKYGLKLGSNAGYLQINLSSALANGDVITFDQGTGTNQISFTTTSTRSTTPATSGETYTVTAGDGLAGFKTLYVWRASASTTYVKELTIATAGAVTSTYSVAFNTASIADDIETLEEQITLPNPLPTPTNVTDGYTFEGWYTDAAFTNAATAGAAINANTTLYANYIIDTPTITPASGAVYAGTTMTLTSSVPFTKAYGGWTGGSAAYPKAELTNGSHNMYVEGPAIDSFSGFTMSTTAGTQYYTYIISDGTFWSRSAITEAYTVSNKITITTQPASATYVQSATPTDLSVEATDTKPAATLSYLWKSSSDGSSWGDASGTNDIDTYTPSTSAVGTTYYKCIVSSDSDAADVESNVVTVTVNSPASYTVSFDSGVGCDTEYDDQKQASAGASISLPSITVKDASKYQFVGWYLDGVKVANADATTYTPSGNVTLVAKYNCKVTLEKNDNGDGNIPTAKNKSTGATIANNSWVFEGTTITLTASPAENFLNWSVGMTGTDNPKDYVVNDYKRFVANYTVPDYKALFHTDFTEDGWSSINGKNGGGTATGVGDDTDAPHNVTMKCGSGISYGWTSGTLTMAAKNYDSENYIAIPVTGVNGELTITVANGSNKTQFKYNVVLGSSTDNPGSSTSTTANKPSTVTVKGLTASNYVVYIGRQSGSYAKYTEITITTPTTKLAADSAQVRIMKNPASDTPTATVHITTNSSGTVSIKTDPTSSIATASYNSGTGVLTITPKGAGTTSVVMQVAQDGDYAARELTIPITVQVPTITIKTQPSNIVCYQNDAADKTFTVVATVNTGNELTYQWYTCDSDGTGESAISGAINDTYTLNTSQKATVGTAYYMCKVSSTGCADVYTEVRSVTVSALSAGGTYSTTVYAITPGNIVTYTGLADNNINNASTTGKDTYYTINNATSGQLVITAKATGTGVITLNDGTVINVTVKNHTVQLIWSAEKVEKDVTDWATDGTKLMLGTDSNPEGLPTLTRLYEDGTAYTGTVTYYIDDTSMAFFNTSGTGSYVQTSGVRPNIYYAGGQGGCKFYAYVAEGSGVEPVKASYDLRLKKGYSNDLPSGRKVEVQQQYTLWKNATDKLITVTYGGYKYNDHKWDGKADSWGSATNYVGKDNAIDGYLYAVRNKDRDAKDEYKHAVQEEDDFGSAWYSTDEDSPKGGKYAAYQRIKPFRLPCRASYITFTAHASGTLTAYVYQNGIIGRGTGAGNQLASAPRLGYWFDEEGWVQEPANTVVTKQVIQKGNARDQRSYGGYADMDAQLDGYWKDAADAIIKTKLRSPWCSVAKPDKDTPESAFSLTKTGSYTHPNPYYWGTATEVENNLAKIIPTPEHPIPHQGGHMIVNEGYVKYTINVEAGKTYYFFGKMTKVGYAGMNFVEADSENRESDQLDLSTTDNWVTLFGASGTALKNTATTIYDKVTVPSNYRIGKWNTICLPFAVDENQVEKVFGKGTELAIFNGLRHDTENHVYYIKYLRHVDQNILPGQPYLIYPTGKAVEERSNQDNGGMKETGEPVPTVGDIIGTGSAGNVKLTFRNVIINKGVKAKSYGCNVDADGTTTSYEFTGTDTPTPIVKYDIYNTPKTGELKRYMGSGTTLNTYHALMKASDSKIQQDAITFAFSEDDVEKAWESNIDDDEPGDPTGIVIIEDEGTSDVRYSGKVTNGKSYNMMGQQVDPTSAKGIILINGKKVMY